MSTSEYERRVLDFLSEIGATQVAVDRSRGSHMALHFRYNGCDRRVTLARSPSDRNAATIKIGDIKKMLGISTQPKTEPVLNPALPTEVVAKLQQPAVEAPKAAAKILPVAKPHEATANGIVSCYASNKCLAFRLPIEVGKCLSTLKGFDIIRNGEGSWEIKKGGRFNGRMEESKYCVFSPSYTAHPELLGNIPVGTTSIPAEYVAVGDHVLVRLLKMPTAQHASGGPEMKFGPAPEPSQAELVAAGNRLGASLRAAKSKDLAPQLTVEDLKAVATAAAVSVPSAPITVAGKGYDTPPKVVLITNIDTVLNYLRDQPEITPDDLRTVLNCVRYIEERTPYRLKRIDGTLVLDARIE